MITINILFGDDVIGKLSSSKEIIRVGVAALSIKWKNVHVMESMFCSKSLIIYGLFRT